MGKINPLKHAYPVNVRLAGLAGIALVIIIFIIFPRFLASMEFEDVDQIIIENIDIPQTQQIDNTPPPARPSIPVPSDDEDIADDLTLDELDFDDFSSLDAPPPPPSGPRVVFIPYDDPPVALSPIRPTYPEIAQEAGIEGVVIVQAFIDKKGRVKETLILKGVPNTGLDEAAMEAIRKTRFRPAKQRERAVGVWISIPVNFKLK
ncbi:MAG: TonB family protein [Candidatus Marinimicrobia bacterium]|jgi:protein TonB|nr:TonB family protein [Candidatus Neomarinimicrobiota bacterium]MDP7076676.1 TonB family protein [Desulfobacterales bacterium]MDP6089757.1 TonB family protein [Candidatus Neomarinimicrobiota bacterium]MDP6820564.1 TonB family protein [Candidatus Neomarinimicrobiota bacterium]MDP6860840.1 TonB family protein [Candidatus Neomarinimicrobiota bacterium]|tara:strand:- start:219 stop:833 length:615 start_codon:yes stop_codon:yes gene_type:complete